MHRGKYCLGERRRYKTCNTSPCARDLPTFRDIQCGHFNTVPYKGRFYRWEAVINRVSPCELHCRPLAEHFSDKMQENVADGTPCYQGNKSRDVCVNGICKNLGCDYVIDSSAVEDRCGVCHGNGSTCTTVRRTFEETEGLGYVDIGLIPEAAWDIRIEEVAEAGNFLALRSDNLEKYFLNGGWTIQWNGEYKAAGTVFTYKRTGHLEHLTSPGPTMEPLWIQLLFQESNPGVRYEYTISRNVSENNVSASDFFWKYGSWTECSVTCGTGVQRQIVHCVEKTTGIVEEHFCDPLTRPDDNRTSCSKTPCPAIWWIGEWHKCSASCGSLGLTKRTVLCTQAVSAEEREALQPSDCQHIPRPESLSSCNTHIPCPADWTTGSWAKCSLTCGSGVRRRDVTCSRNTGVDCDPHKKPLAGTPCHAQDCPQVVDNFGDFDWSGSGWSSKEVINEIISLPEVKAPPKHSTTRAQPRSSNNHLNNIVEGDFHYHNNLEDNVDRPPENGVEVDDFYYDYNFINFHEDLSDDFDDDGKDSEAGHGLDAPREAEPTRGAKENEAAKAPLDILTYPQATGYTLKTEEPQNTNPDDTKDDGNAATNESMQTHLEDLDDLLSEDYLLPVSTTRSPPFSTSDSQTPQERREEDLSWPQVPSTTSRLVSTTEEPTTRRVKWQPYGEETENNSDIFTDDVTVTPKRVSSAPEHGTAAAVTNVRAQTGGERDDYGYNENVTLGPDISADQEDVERPEPVGSPTPATIIQVQTEVRLEKSASKIPQTTRQSTTAFTLEDLVPASTTSEANSWDIDLDLGATSLPASEASTPLPATFPLNPGNREASDDFTPLTGTEIPPPANQEEAAPPDYPPATGKRIPTLPPSTERPGTRSASQAPSPDSPDSPDFDNDDMAVPSMTSSSSDPGPSYRLPTNAVTAPRPTPGVPISPTQPPDLRPLPVPTSAPTSASARVTSAAFWVAGNWSACSTSCGLGAIWRTLACRTGLDSDCDPAKRPAPAQRCYLRPCSTWKVEEWTKCSKNCEGGFKSREVQCFDLRDQRPLRPFHCRAMSSRPHSQMTCNLQPCLDWYTSSWGQCSAHCGGGVEHRLIKCVNTKAETGEEVDQAQCDRERHPESSQKCNLQECESAPSGESVNMPNTVKL
ncbi:A disintegrin and metalloproteinase with thrombospondin motifs 7 [Liparis tanakae]|uniref:A disintegrin and metalloproteinase with thrombospondin motifs 7 n=1 Tax=Liparis tanakae TaxID=230148 RepID=A0A4Z2HH34_9TELE|nr:A disintegrin and metalloproteinase with thrombospondin motifs 7 [Liparis tanakae]